jgi:hypothetical protein
LRKISQAIMSNIIMVVSGRMSVTVSAERKRREKFFALGFPSCRAVVGLQLGRAKIFDRGKAFDRFDSTRQDKFFRAAAAIQKIVLGHNMIT